MAELWLNTNYSKHKVQTFPISSHASQASSPAQSSFLNHFPLFCCLYLGSDFSYYYLPPFPCTFLPALNCVLSMNWMTSPLPPDFPQLPDFWRAPLSSPVLQSSGAGCPILRPPFPQFLPHPVNPKPLDVSKNAFWIWDWNTPQSTKLPFPPSFTSLKSIF